MTLTSTSSGEGSDIIIELTERQSELRGKFDTAMHDVYSKGDGSPLTVPETSKDIFYEVWTSWKELDPNTQSHLEQTLNDGDLYPSFLDRWNREHPADAEGRVAEYPDHTVREVKPIDVAELR